MYGKCVYGRKKQNNATVDESENIQFLHHQTSVFVVILNLDPVWIGLQRFPST